MKAIKDCKWRVKIKYYLFGDGDEFFWVAKTKDISGVDDDELVADRFYKEESAAKKNWEQFARINKIKNWEYVN